MLYSVNDFLTITYCIIDCHFLFLMFSNFNIETTADLRTRYRLDNRRGFCHDVLILVRSRLLHARPCSKFPEGAIVS